MVVSSVLVAGGDVTGCVTAAMLAQRGLEVTLVEGAADGQSPDGAITLYTDPEHLLRELGVFEVPERSPLAAALAMRMRELRIEVRASVRLIGSAPVDHHVEAELSDGRIENYDLVIVSASERELRLIATEEVLRSETVAALTRTLRPAA